MSISFLKHFHLTLLGAIAGAISLNVVPALTPGGELAIAQTDTQIAQIERKASQPSADANSGSAGASEPASTDVDRPVLTMGMKNGAVKDLKRRLKKLGYYQGNVTSVYDEVTRDAVVKFQTEHSLEPTGEFDLGTFEVLERQEQKVLQKAQEQAQQKQARQRKLLLVGFGGMVGLVGLAGGTYFLLRLVNQGGRDEDDAVIQGSELPEPVEQGHTYETTSAQSLLPPSVGPVYPPSSSSKFERMRSPRSATPHTLSNGHPSDSTVATAALVVDEWTEPPVPPAPEMNGANSSALSPATDVSNATVAQPSSVPTLSKTPVHSNGHRPSRLVTSARAEFAPLLDRVELLIRDLQSLDAETRRQAIWELAQDSDSRAVQPLVNLLLDSDSQQQGLILEALSQIGIRTLKPINRALALSIQDDNAQVRKNAIRDVTHIYSLVAQLGHLVSYATDDPDPDVQVTAKWALEQIKQIRTTDQSES